MFQAPQASPVKFTYQQEIQVSQAVTPGTVLVTGAVGLGRPRSSPVSRIRPCHSPAGTEKCSGQVACGVAFGVQVGAEVMNWVHDFGNRRKR